MPLPLRMAKVMLDPMRLKIAVEMGKRDMSASQFYEQFGEEGDSVARVARHIKVLEKYGWLEEVDAKTGGKRRGAIERFYRTIRPPTLFENADLASLPDHLRSALSVRWITTAAERCMEAIRAGTFDARDDTHSTWTPLEVDEQGWASIRSKVDALFLSLPEEQERAKERLAASGEEPISMTVLLGAFESPRD